MGNLTQVVAQQRITERIKDGTERRMRAQARAPRGRWFIPSMWFIPPMPARGSERSRTE